MNKKIIVLVFVVLILAVAGGGFFWWVWEEYQKEKRFEEMTVGELFSVGVLPKGFVAKETAEGFFLENIDLGISFEVPKDWEFIGYMDELVDIKSPDYSHDPDTFVRIRGCLITIEVSYYSLFTSSNIINRIDRIQKGDVQSENEEIMKISGRDVLRNIIENETLLKEGVKEIIEIGIPFVEPKAEIKLFSKIFKFDRQPSCTQEFNEFLDTILIR